jgi:hypothetical protein
MCLPTHSATYLHVTIIVACQHVGFIVTNYKMMKQLSKCLIEDEI